MNTSINPDAARDPVDLLVDEVERSLDRLPKAVNLMTLGDWISAITDAMPWNMPDIIRHAAIVLTARYER